MLGTRKCIMDETLIILYHSFVYPYLIYCNYVWNLVCKTYVDTENNKVTAGDKMRSNTDTIIKELKLLKCNDINTYLTHLPLDKTAAISQAIYSDACL